MTLCNCGHTDMEHLNGPSFCMALVLPDGSQPDDPFVLTRDLRKCPCKAFDDALLPDPGEPLVFGVHRLRSTDAETAPAWPPLSVVARRQSERSIRGLRKLR